VDGNLEAALRRFDELNAQDPNTELVNGVPRPCEPVPLIVQCCPTLGSGKASPPRRSRPPLEASGQIQLQRSFDDM
jgi:hypothetical protein